MLLLCLVVCGVLCACLFVWRGSRFSYSELLTCFVLLSCLFALFAVVLLSCVAVGGACVCCVV